MCCVLTRYKHCANPFMHIVPFNSHNHKGNVIVPILEEGKLRIQELKGPLNNGVGTSLGLTPEPVP